ncbi:MAG: ArsB/NhaD family transporter [Candidatus Bipolaricaulia bacterium]
MAAGSTFALVASSLVFVATYVFIVGSHTHRTLAAFVGAVVMILLGKGLGIYGSSQALAAIDFDTLALLFGLAIIVEVLKSTGSPAYLAVKISKLTKGSPWKLLVSLGLLTSVVSMFLDNVTTIMLVAPIMISVSDIVGISAVPLLMGGAMLSNIGGIATLIGDPPNILIGSAASLSFMDFLTHTGPIALLVWGPACALLLLLFKKELSHRPQNLAALEQMEARRALSNPRAAFETAITVAGVLILFFFHDLLGLSPGLVALIGAAATLALLRPSLNALLAIIPWEMFLFFGSLFVLVGGLEASGLLGVLRDALAGLTEHGMELAAVVVLWLSAVMSSLIDRIPFTIAMIPILSGLAASTPQAGVLWWALALGVGLGANASPIGSLTNIVTISISEASSKPLSYADWLKKGPLVALTSCSIASLVLVAAIHWHVF